MTAYSGCVAHILGKEHRFFCTTCPLTNCLYVYMQDRRAYCRDCGAIPIYLHRCQDDYIPGVPFTLTKIMYGLISLLTGHGWEGDPLCEPCWRASYKVAFGHDPRAA